MGIGVSDFTPHTPSKYNSCTLYPSPNLTCTWVNKWHVITGYFKVRWEISLGSRREAIISVKISGLVCVVSHLILLSTKTAGYSVIIWPSLWFTGPPSDLLLAELTTDHRPYRKHWQEISELFMPEGLCMKPWADLNLKLFASIDPHHDAVILKLYRGFKSLM